MKRAVKKKATKKKAAAKKKVVAKKKVATKKKAAVKKGVTKKAVTKRATTKKKATRKKAAAAAPKKIKGTRKAYTKSELHATLAENTGLSKKEIASVMEALGDIIHAHVKKRAVGEFTLPGLLKIKTVRKPAQPARKGVPNPFRPGELMDVAAKPARTVVKIRPLKKLKEMVE